MGGAGASRGLGATFWATAREALVAAMSSARNVGIDLGIVARRSSSGYAMPRLDETRGISGPAAPVTGRAIRKFSGCDPEIFRIRACRVPPLERLSRE
jgi:hypothetical protein